MTSFLTFCYMRYFFFFSCLFDLMMFILPMLLRAADAFDTRRFSTRL